MSYKTIEGGVTAPKGFRAAAKYCAIKVKKEPNPKPDVTVVVSDCEASCAAVFTTNKFCAAPVILGREVLKKGKARAFVINSGNANAATGEQGIANAKKVETELEKLLGLGEDEVFVSSTGVIGQQLPVEKLLAGLPEIVANLSDKGGTEAARAIMTTDTKLKEVAFELELSGGTVCIGAMAIIGAIQDGLLGDYSLLVTKAVLDFIIVLIMTCSLGKGCMFSAIPVAVFQGSVTALAGLLRPLMTAAALANLSLVGSILIFCVGLNLVWDKRVRVANLLPAVVIAVAAAFLPFEI